MKQHGPCLICPLSLTGSLELRTFDYETHGGRGCAVALKRTGVIPSVVQAEGGKLQVGLPVLGRELLTVLLPGQLEQRGWPKLQRTLQTIGGPLLSCKDHLLLHPPIVHTRLSCRRK